VLVNTWPLAGVEIVAAWVGGGEDMRPSIPNELVWGFCEEPNAPADTGTSSAASNSVGMTPAKVKIRCTFITITLMENPTEDKPSIVF
jgi:hypothetical protein